MQEPTKTNRRRWFQFGLRTMFVVVTLLACVLGWVAFNLHWIRERHRFLVEVDRSDEFRMETLLKSLGDINSAKAIPQDDPGNENAQIQYIKLPEPPQPPGLLWLFGEPARPKIIVSVDHPDPRNIGPEAKERVERAKALFPEATIDTVFMDPQGRIFRLAMEPEQ